MEKMMTVMYLELSALKVPYLKFKMSLRMPRLDRHSLQCIRKMSACSRYRPHLLRYENLLLRALGAFTGQ